MSERDEVPGQTITGIPYTWIPYTMYDFLIIPLYKRKDTGEPVDFGKAQFVDAKILYDETGANAIGIEIIMQEGENQFVVEPYDVRIMKIEDNAGTGLKHPFKQTELMRVMQEIADRTGRRPGDVSPTEVDNEAYGRQLRIMLYEFARMGRADRERRLGQAIAWPESAEADARSLEQRLPEGAAWSKERTKEILDRAVIAARRTMPGKAANAPFSVNELAIVLKYYALEGITQDIDALRAQAAENPGMLGELSRKAFQMLYDHKDMYDSILETGDFDIIPDVLKRLIRDAKYIDRVAQLAVSDVAVKPEHPEIELVVAPLTAAETAKMFEGMHQHTIIFEDTLTSMNDLFVFMKSAHAYNRSKNRFGVPVHVACVNKNWITDGKYRQAIVYDAERDMLREVMFENPVDVKGSIDIRNLYVDTEQETHYTMSRAYERRNGGSIQTNPYHSAKKADSKYWAYRLWREAGIDTPESLFIPQGSTSFEIERRIMAFLHDVADSLDTIHLVVQPNFGTEGIGTRDFAVSMDDIKKGSEFFDYVAGLAASDSVIISQAVGNVFYSDSVRASHENAYRCVVRANVVYDGRGYGVDSYSGFISTRTDEFIVSRRHGGIHLPPNGQESLFNNIWMNENGVLIKIIVTEDMRRRLEERVCEAVRLLNRNHGNGARGLIYGVDILLEAYKNEAGKIELIPVIKEVNPRPTGLAHCAPLGTDSEMPDLSAYWKGVVTETLRKNGIAALPTTPEAAIMWLVTEDLDVYHGPILDSITGTQVEVKQKFSAVLGYLLDFLKLDSQAAGSYRKIYLLQERAIIVVGDILWRMKHANMLPAKADLDRVINVISADTSVRNDMAQALADYTLERENREHYMNFMNQFLRAANEREIRDFMESKEMLLAEIQSSPIKHARPGVLYRAICPMRVGVTSANASDNWTFSKLIGGMVMNFAVDISLDENHDPTPPMTISMHTLDTPGIVLETISNMDVEDGYTDQIEVTKDNVIELFGLSKEHKSAVLRGAQLTPDMCFKGSKDPLRMIKYALIFSGIVHFKGNEDEYISNPRRILEDIWHFTGDKGLKITIDSRNAPVRSGFSSSSTVALGLLKVLYKASGQDQLAENRILSCMALLMENELSLKSGKQDTDGPLYPGMKDIDYFPTEGFLESSISYIEDIDLDSFFENLIIVNTGIQRPQEIGMRRGLNMRHYSYISRDPERFPAVMESLDVHMQIVDAVRNENWAKLGTLFNRYMDLREIIDPGATASLYDAAAGRKVLRYPYEELIRQGLVYGGMYTGAMGGGCMMLVPTALGKEQLSGGKTRLAAALEAIKAYTAGSEKPFRRLQPYKYAVNPRGIVYDEQEMLGAGRAYRDDSDGPDTPVAGDDMPFDDTAKSLEGDYDNARDALVRQLPQVSPEKGGPNALIMYADQLIDRGVVFDIERTLSDTEMGKRNVLTGGKVVLFTESKGKNDEDVKKLARLVKKGDPTIKVILVDEGDLKELNKPLATDYQIMDALKDMAMRALRQDPLYRGVAIQQDKVLGIMRGHTGNMTKMAGDAASLEVPVVVFNRVGFHSFALGLQSALKIRQDVAPARQKAWLSLLEPIRAVLTDRIEEFKIYIRDVLTKA
ncbi:MAG: hypothetical protein ABH885_01545 [Candidatus Omnitrophota bacterium]